MRQNFFFFGINSYLVNKIRRILSKNFAWKKGKDFTESFFSLKRFKFEVRVNDKLNQTKL